MPGFHLYLCLYWATMHHSISSTQEVKLRTLRPYTSWKHFQTCYCVNHRFPRILVGLFLQQLPNPHREPHFCREDVNYLKREANATSQSCARSAKKAEHGWAIGAGQWIACTHEALLATTAGSWNKPWQGTSWTNSSLGYTLFSQVLALKCGCFNVFVDDALPVVGCHVHTRSPAILDAMICKVCNRIGK